MQPSVADGIGYAGSGIGKSPNPEGVASLALARDRRRCNPVGVGVGEDFPRVTRGSLADSATPG